MSWGKSLGPRRARAGVTRGFVGALTVVTLVLAGAVAAPPAHADATATVMVRTQRMADASLGSGQDGWYERGARLALQCYKRGQAVAGYFSGSVPGGRSDIWYRVSDGRYVADIDIQTGSNNPVTGECVRPFAAAPNPTVSGAVRVGATVNAVTDGWNPGDAAFSFQWQLDGRAVGGATGRTWTLPATAEGARVSVIATATRAGYDTTRRTSATTARVAAGVFVAPQPVLSGDPSVGSRLRLTLAGWSPTPARYTVQWYSAGAAVAGATGTTYVIRAADVGRTITARVNAASPGYASVSKGSVGVAVLRPLTATPTPTVSGTADVGGRLTARPGTWGPGTIALAYQWMRDGAPIPGATASAYAPAAADAGASVSVRVTGSRAGYVTVARTSAPVGIARPLSQTPTPWIAGTPTVGETLTAKRGTWAPAPVALAYQWYRNGQSIAGARGLTYVATKADAGAQVAVRVTGSRSGYTSVARTSAAVVVGRDLVSAAPRISGVAVVGRTLTAAAGDWGPAPVALTYRWYRGSEAITGATRASYTVSAEDAGRALRVVVTGTKAGYTAESRRSAAVTVAPTTPTTAEPTIAGTRAAGHALTAQPGAWGPGAVSFAYQWYLDGAPIGGATAQSWTVTPTAAGGAVHVVVTGTRDGFTPANRGSAAIGIDANAGTSLPIHHTLRPGAYLQNGSYRAILQGDGNFVVYHGGTARWGSRTDGQAPRYLALQGDGNLVLYRTDGRAVWSTSTNGRGGANLVMQGDGNLVLYSGSGQALWASNTAAGGGGGGTSGWARPVAPPARLTTYPGHNGDDFPVGVGTPVYAMGAGTVSFATYPIGSWCPLPGKSGNQTDLRVATHRDGNRYDITYAHLSSYAVSSGQTVQAGQLIGYSGNQGCSSGPHLHIDIKVNGVANRLYPHDIFGWAY